MKLDPRFCFNIWDKLQWHRQQDKGSVGIEQFIDKVAGGGVASGGVAGGGVAGEGVADKGIQVK